MKLWHLCRSRWNHLVSLLLAFLHRTHDSIRHHGEKPEAKQKLQNTILEITKDTRKTYRGAAPAIGELEREIRSEWDREECKTQKDVLHFTLYRINHPRGASVPPNIARIIYQRVDAIAC